MRQRLEMVDERVFDRVSRALEQIGSTERQYRKWQTQYRVLASIWLLATYAGLLVIVSRYSGNAWGELSAAAAATAGALGIGLLWVVDVLAHRQPLATCVMEARQLEREYSWLPQLRGRLVEFPDGRWAQPADVWFYAGAIVPLVGIAGVSLTWWLGRAHWLAALFSLLFTLDAAFFAGYLVASISHSALADSPEPAVGPGSR